MSISTRPLVLGICLLAACSPRHNGADDDGTGDGGKATDACRCPDGGSEGSSAGCNGTSAGAAQPIGNHARAYHAGTILPSHRSQGQLDEAVRTFYDAWKADYLRAGCGTGRYYVLSGGGHQT